MTFSVGPRVTIGKTCRLSPSSTTREISDASRSGAPSSCPREADRPGVYPLLRRLAGALARLGLRLLGLSLLGLLRLDLCLCGLHGQRSQHGCHESSCNDQHQETCMRCQKPFSATGSHRRTTACRPPGTGMTSQYPWMVLMDQPLLHTDAATMMMVDRVGPRSRLYFFPDRLPGSTPEFQGDPVRSTV